eukprot:TRINITY_DN9121_c0_g2_i1.p2 TRINITY_DN9121_c0_g2~~TRINITY_DN9121_c0_g2_i1.p2  ORF type:complete len:156 (+),score=35.80 TRINITY_DN9121_c0_g2_i1:864-1331(+)
MTTIRLFRPDDLLRFNNVNLDVLTETYNMPFYFHYMAKWPELFVVGQAPDNKTIMGYIMGKVEGSEAKQTLHGHVTALTVSPQFRRLNLAQRMMKYLEDVSERHDSFFVDLFVRVSNEVAIDMYSKLGYSVYRRVIGYYSGEEDAFDMRKALPRE